MTKRRTYTKEFKIEAVELADEIDNSAQAECDLGIPHGQIREESEASDQTDGSPRICRQLRANGICCGENRVARLMRKAGLRAMRPGRARPRTTVSDPRLPTFENVLKRDFAAEALDRKWAADITYIPTDEGWFTYRWCWICPLGAWWAGP